ncbi:MAG: hypothetical protein AB8G11_08455 [Saprospiraceae bacterium]
MRTIHYASFDNKQGKALQNDEPKQVSEQQERYENIINQYI